jgi:hypothetical protein
MAQIYEKNTFVVLWKPVFFDIQVNFVAEQSDFGRIV